MAQPHMGARLVVQGLDVPDTPLGDALAEALQPTIAADAPHRLKISLTQKRSLSVFDEGGRATRATLTITADFRYAATSGQIRTRHSYNRADSELLNRANEDELRARAVAQIVEELLRRLDAGKESR